MKESQRRAIDKYFQTEKGKEAHRRASSNWREKNPEKAKEVKQKYEHSEKGKSMRREANRRYREKMKQKSALLEK